MITGRVGPCRSELARLAVPRSDKLPYNLEVIMENSRAIRIVCLLLLFAALALTHVREPQPTTAAPKSLPQPAVEDVTAQPRTDNFSYYTLRPDLRRCASPYTAFYTLTFVHKGGSWKAVAMHTSRQ